MWRLTPTGGWGKVDGPFDTETWKEHEIVQAYYQTLVDLEEAIRSAYEKTLLASAPADRMLMHDPDRQQAQEEPTSEPPEWLRIYWEVKAHGGMIWAGGWWSQPHIATKIFNLCANIEREIQVAAQTMQEARRGAKAF